MKTLMALLLGLLLIAPWPYPAATQEKVAQTKATQETPAQATATQQTPAHEKATRETSAQAKATRETPAQATATRKTPAHGKATTTPAVVTTQGTVIGTTRGRVHSFQGIPYAIAERFAAPRPAPAWTGIREAVTPGKACAQPPGYPIGRPSTDEDCLSLNITTPATGHRRLPVIVWIHGGSMTVGLGDLYGPDRLVTGGAVVVSMNYRLGVASFLAHPSLPESGGLALDDQRAAMRWVRDNIRAFGGDPGNVTIMGESGGGYSVCGHLASPASAGLFQRAIIQSAPCGVPGSASRTRAEAQAESDPVITAVGCADAADVAGCLRRVPVDDLLEAYGHEREPRPISGTATLPEPVDRALRAGRFSRVPILVGVNHDEENAMVLGRELATGVPLSTATVAAEIRRDHGDEALRRYPIGIPPARTLARVNTDARWSAPTLDLARTLSHWTTTRMYEFAEPETPWYAGYPAPGFPAAAQHMSELPYLFDLPLYDELSPVQAALGHRMITAWVRFAATGDPGWPRLLDRPGGWHVLSLTSGPWRRTDFAGDHLYRFWSAPGR